MANTKTSKITIPQQECEKQFQTEQRKRQHIIQHEQGDNHLNKLYNLDKEGKVDRIQVIYMGTPTENTTHANELIKYNAHTQLWHCAKCERTEQPQDKRNLIQHAVREHRKKQKQKTIYQKSN